MHLSRVEICTDKEASRRALVNPQRFHAAVEGCFPDGQGSKDRNLWRIDRLGGKLYILILSRARPVLSDMERQFSPVGVMGQTREYGRQIDGIATGLRYRFRLTANPVHSVRSKDKPGERGKIYPHVTTEQKRNWLAARSTGCGFSLQEGAYDMVEARVVRFRKTSSFGREANRPVEISTAVFEGELLVTDATLFAKTLIEGIGRAKAYGCGLLTVVRIEK